MLSLFFTLVCSFFLPTPVQAKQPLCKVAHDIILNQAGLGNTGHESSLVRGSFPSCSKFPNLPQALLKNESAQFENSLQVQSGVLDTSGHVIPCESREILVSGKPIQWGVVFEGKSFSDYGSDFRLLNTLMDSIQVQKIINRAHIFSVNSIEAGSCTLKEVRADICLPVRRTLFLGHTKQSSENASQCETVDVSADECGKLGKLYDIISAAKKKAIQAEKDLKRGANVNAAHKKAGLDILGPSVADFLNQAGLAQKPIAALYNWRRSFIVISTEKWGKNEIQNAFSITVDAVGHLVIHLPELNEDADQADFEKLLAKDYSYLKINGQVSPVAVKDKKALSSVPHLVNGLALADGAEYILRYEIAKIFLMGDVCDRLKDFN